MVRDIEFVLEPKCKTSTFLICQILSIHSTIREDELHPKRTHKPGDLDNEDPGKFSTDSNTSKISDKTWTTSHKT